MPDAAFLRTFRRQYISRTVPSGSVPSWDEYGDNYSLDYRAACAVVLLPRRFALLPHQNLSLLYRHLPSEAIIPGRVVRY